MAAGDPFVASLVDEYIRKLVTRDAKMKEYAPGGYTPVDPGSEYKSPVVRSWMHVPGETDFRQDGQMGRAQSNPVFVITMLDLQPAKKLDHTYGSWGSQFKPWRPHLRDGSFRLSTIFHNHTETTTVEIDGTPYTYTFTSECFNPYRAEEPVTASQNNVMEGHMVRFWIS